ncbi:MAG: sarcosine oxidase subunit gamma family protein [Roseiarcus sp.]
MPPDAMTPLAERRSALHGRALLANGKVEAVALPVATRFILRGGPEVAEPVGAAFGVAPPSRPLRAIGEGARAALWLGPDEWLLIAEDEPAELGAELEAALAGIPHALVDVSHRQCAIEVAGAGAARLLNAGVPLDLDLAAFPVGMATRTLLLKAEIVLWRREAERFRVETGRSFAPYVAAVLDASARDQELC